tara:strand:+ start:693 stop:830 length:138 start_codon:yes stop_codon:yes gene_type:complete
MPDELMITKLDPCEKPLNRSSKDLIIGVNMIDNNQKNLYGIPYEQ